MEQYILICVSRNLFNYLCQTLNETIDIIPDSDAILKILSVDFFWKGESKFGFLVQNCVRIQIFTSMTYSQADLQTF